MQINWDSRAISEKTVNKVKKSMLRVAVLMTRDIKQSMQGYGRYSKINTGQEEKGVRRTKTGRRHYPSPPGSPPAVDTGRLRSSISFNWTGSGKGRGDTEAGSGKQDGVGQPPSEGSDTFTVVVGTNVVYGRYLELGTNKMLPRPYLRPILEKYRSIIANIFREET
jgi:hypothetical protein